MDEIWDWMAFKRWFKRRDNEILKNFEGKEIILRSTFANFFGQESKGARQVRENGLIVLTRDELYFEMYTLKNKLPSH